jgi:hypothetical protein
VAARRKVPHRFSVQVLQAKAEPRQPRDPYNPFTRDFQKIHLTSILDGDSRNGSQAAS